MTEKAVLIEQSFADAIAMIAAAEELPEHTRRHWPTSLRKIAQALDKPLAVIPARYSAIRNDLTQLHHVPAGLTAKTLANHKSNVKSALLYLGRRERSSAVRRALEWSLAAPDGPDRRQSCPLALVIVRAVLFGQQRHAAGRG